MSKTDSSEYRRVARAMGIERIQKSGIRIQNGRRVDWKARTLTDTVVDC